MKVLTHTASCSHNVGVCIRCRSLHQGECTGCDLFWFWAWMEGGGKVLGMGLCGGDCWRKEFPFTVAFDLVVVGLCRVESERMTIYDSRCTCTCTYITSFHHPRWRDARRIGWMNVLLRSQRFEFVDTSDRLKASVLRLPLRDNGLPDPWV